MEFQRPPLRDSLSDRLRDNLATRLLQWRLAARRRIRSTTPEAAPRRTDELNDQTPRSTRRQTAGDEHSLSTGGSVDAVDSASIVGRFDRGTAPSPSGRWRYPLTVVVGVGLGFVAANILSARQPGSVETLAATDAKSSETSGGAAPVAELPIITGPARSSTTTTTVLIVVHAAGAFRRPGVYVFPFGARVDDLVAAAGGVNPGAQTDVLNLAAPLADGQRIWVPIRGQPIPTVAPVDIAPAVTPGPASAGGATAGRTGAVINLNTATVEQLDSLPGIGPSTAAAIVEYRTAHQAFRSIAELLNVRGIGEAKLAALKAKVTL